MQGGAPNNNANPYSGYPANAGGYNPQQQQQQQAGMQGYPAGAGRGGYYPQQQQQQPQQQYGGGYPQQGYGQGYAPRGGYQQQQQGGYAPRGGYSQAGYGGYNQGYYPQQQQQGGYYNQGYNNNNNGGGNMYGQMAYGGYQGGAYRGGQGYNQQQQPYGGGGGRGGFQRGRGGPNDFQRGGARGGGRGGGRGGRGGAGRHNETVAVVHLDSYAQLEEAGRKGATEELLPAELLNNLRARSRGSPIKLLVLIQKKYAAACLSLPRHSDDALLAEKTAETFLPVTCVSASHGNRLVDVANGGFIQGAMYNIFRSLMVTLTPFDKPRATPAAAADGAPAEQQQQQQPAVEVQEKPTEELLEALTKDVATYEAVLTAMSADSDDSTKLFARLMRLDTAEEGEHEGDDNAEEGEDAEHHAGEDGGDEAKAAEKAAPATAAGGPKKPQHTLMSSPQGIQILRAALAVSSKRHVFFEKLAPPAKAESDAPTRVTWTTSLRLLNPLFQYPLLSELLYQLFGLVPAGATDMKAAKPKAAELKVLCDAVVRYGVVLSSSASSGNTLLSLLHAVDPQQAKSAAAEHAAEEASRKPGMKRGRDAEEATEATAADDAAQKAKTEEATAATAAAAEQRVHAPASLAEYKAPAAPQDAHLYYALAEAWCTGEMPQERRRRDRADAPAQPDAEAAAAPATVESRLQHVSRNITGSLIVRYMMPIFADAVLASLKSPASRKKKEHDAYVRNCETLLSAMAASWSTTNPTYTDGYVYRSLLTSLAPRAVPGTPVEAAMQALNERIIQTIFEASREKYHSHCVQEALTVARQTKDGVQFVLQVARALMEKGDEALLSLAVSPSGNYVVRHLCDQLTEYATGKVEGADAAAVEETKELEASYFQFMSNNLAKLSSVQYGRGLVGWQRDQAARLAQPSASATPAAPAAAPAAPAAAAPTA